MKKPQTNIKKDQFSAHKACVAYIWCYYYNFKEYCENPYKGEEMKDNMDLIQDDEVGEYILDANFKRELADLKSKAPGCNDIPADLIYSLGDQATEFLYHLSNKMYEGGVVPEEFNRNIIVAPD